MAEVHTTLLDRLRMAKDIALGMNWLHSNRPPILHRDLNPSNLVCGDNLHVKISDYGLARIRDDNADRMDAQSGGTPYWYCTNRLFKHTPHYLSSEYSN